ncbi:MAG: glycosyltransferase [Candidatus Hydrogenedentes bacterium]|nr:glycosyltransferase [Candidatus Hydrogenedentota bacterium]
MAEHETKNAPIVVCMPAFNEWASLALLIPDLSAALSAAGISARVLIVDDASTEPMPPDFLAGLVGPLPVDVLRLRRNLGHQRAIAIGLAYIAEHLPCEAVVVMDADGEDPPAGAVALVRAFRDDPHADVIFARRRRRVEGPLFRGFYAIYKAMHRILVGRTIEVGNFSIVPRAHVERLGAVMETWNHYAASVYHARIPNRSIPLDRARRLAGHSRMNFVALVMHGLCAISVYGDIVAVRLLVSTAALLGLSLAAAAALVAGHALDQAWAPLWAAAAAGLAAVALLQMLYLAGFASFLVLQNRSGTGFLPRRDYVHFVEGCVHVRG